MANVVEYGEPMYIAYSAACNFGSRQIDTLDELIKIIPVIFDGQPTGGDLLALPDECRIEMNTEEGAYFFCIASDYYGTSAAKVGVPLYPFYSASSVALSFFYDAASSGIVGSYGKEDYKYLYVYKQPDGRGFRLARCNTYVAIPEYSWASLSSYNVERLQPGDYVAFQGAPTPTKIAYNGNEIASLESGQTATMSCSGKKMKTDIVVAFGSAGTITYNGMETAVEAGKTATLQCAEKKMTSDVFVIVKDTGTGGALIDIAFGENGGKNIGYGGSDYDATFSGVTFTSDGSGFEISSAGYLTVPTGFMATPNPWTIAFTIKNYAPSFTTPYGRFARGNNDVPSLFYTDSYNGLQVKLATGSVNGNIVTFVNPDETVKVEQDTAIVIRPSIYPPPEPITFVFRNDGEYISFWMNGNELFKQVTSAYAESKYASTFSIGDNAGVGYSLNYLLCTMLKAWDRGLTDEEISNLS